MLLQSTVGIRVILSVRPSVRHNSIFSKTADVSSSANPTLEYTMAVNTGKMATGSIDDVEEFQCNGKDSK